MSAHESSKAPDQMRTFLVERMKRERIEVTICATTAQAMGGDWEAAATAAAEDRADWETFEYEINAFDKDDFVE